MTVKDFLDSVQVGYIVQVTWNGAVFEPDMIIRPGEKATGLSKVYTCGFAAYIDPDKAFISVAATAMHEGENTESSFRSVVIIPVSAIESAEIYGGTVK